MYSKYNNYDKYPEVKVSGFDNEAFEGYDDILNELKNKLNGINKNKKVLVLDFYPGVNEEEVLNAFSKLNPTLMIHSDDCAYDSKTMWSMMEEYLTDDRVFGLMNTKKLKDFFIDEKIIEARKIIEGTNEGLIIIYGVGASLISKGDILAYFDLARWEIQLRYRSGMANWKGENYDAPILSKYKRGFFLEWRMADKHKKSLYKHIDFLIDTNTKDNPKMISGNAFLYALNKTSKRPFRVVPYFDPGVWGGQWMKDVCGLDKSSPNYAWSFDGVPEENSLLLKFGNIQVEVPSIDVVFTNPVNLLGDRVHGRFGTEFPIRFDFLDTMGGGNLSLQVHPLTEYIQETFGMHYTQDESYYMLDAEQDAVVYLGVKEGINKDDMIYDLKRAEKGEIKFPDEKYINKFPAKKHDHFLIPAGTIHCSGKNAMVLEISATPYIFTFKLWDWERVGLDGLPRPIHLSHGEKVIQWDRDTKWVEENLVGQVEVLHEEDGIKIERTGLHKREFIETIRYWFSKPVLHSTEGSVNVLNLVEGAEAIVESPTSQFEPFVVHYAETFIIPEAVKEYTIRPYGKSEGETVGVIKAFVRG